ncbi:MULTISPECIES: cytochrome C oxidase subunit IV family protein [unclassified Rhizobium]|uniref:cytochrome C oxidase subunit IV family protein n=1 Tax=unclassified Rhizobium TaxID=2613769 RepID=UPI0021677351|nr:MULTISPECIES: cytochrome C oxidase subunit IV family protein [unclassified Rhizobium]
MSCGYSSIRHFTSRDDEIWIVRPFLFVWFALMLPLAATLVASFVLTGPFGLATSLTIAFAKTALIYWFFMHLNKERGLSRLTRLPRSAGSSSCFSLFC